MLGKRGRRRGEWHWSRLLCDAPHHSQRRETIIGKDGRSQSPSPTPSVRHPPAKPHLLNLSKQCPHLLGPSVQMPKTIGNIAYLNYYSVMSLALLILPKVALTGIEV